MHHLNMGAFGMHCGARFCIVDSSVSCIFSAKFSSSVLSSIFSAKVASSVIFCICSANVASSVLSCMFSAKVASSVQQYSITIDLRDEAVRSCCFCARLEQRRTRFRGNRAYCPPLLLLRLLLKRQEAHRKGKGYTDRCCSCCGCCLLFKPVLSLLYS